MSAFLLLGERVAACGDGAGASVRRSERGSETRFRLSSFKGGGICELISLTSLLFLIADWSSSFGRSSLARGDGSRAFVRCRPRQ